MPFNKTGGFTGRPLQKGLTGKPLGQDGISGAKATSAVPPKSTGSLTPMKPTSGSKPPSGSGGK